MKLVLPIPALVLYNIVVDHHHNYSFAICFGVDPAALMLLYGPPNPLRSFPLAFFATMAVVVASASLGLGVIKRAEIMEKRYRARIGRARLEEMAAAEGTANLHPSLEHARGVLYFPLFSILLFLNSKN